MDPRDKEIFQLKIMIEEMQKKYDESRNAPAKRDHSNSDPEEAKKQRAIQDSKKSQYFTLMLYPDCEEHCRILEYIKAHEHITKYVYILHDKDVWLEDDEDDENEDDVELNPRGEIGSLKKPHWHVLIKTKIRSVPKSVAKFYGLKCVLKCNNPVNYMLYMLHDTLQSKQKAQYTYEELQGTDELKRLIAHKNANFVQLEKMLALMHDAPTVADMMTVVQQTSVEWEWLQFAEFVLKHGALVVGMSNQEIKRKQDRQFDSSMLHAIQEGAERERRRAVMESYGAQLYKRGIDVYNAWNEVDNFEEVEGGLL